MGIFLMNPARIPTEGIDRYLRIMEPKYDLRFVSAIGHPKPSFSDNTVDIQIPGE